jgi:hypothetical protein
MARTASRHGNAVQVKMHLHKDMLLRNAQALQLLIVAVQEEVQVRSENGVNSYALRQEAISQELTMAVNLTSPLWNSSRVLRGSLILGWLTVSKDGPGA